MPAMQTNSIASTLAPPERLCAAASGADVAEPLAFETVLRRERVADFALRWGEDFPRRRRATTRGLWLAVTPFAVQHHALFMDEISFRVAREWAHSTPAGQGRAVSAMFADAVRDQVCVRNPFDGVTFPHSVGRRFDTPPTETEVMELARTAVELYPGWFGVVLSGQILLGFYVAARPGEVLALRHLDLSPADGLVTIAQTWSADRWLEPPKGGLTRTVPLPSAAVDAYEQICEVCSPEAPGDLVFRTPTGAPAKPGNMWSYWDKVRTAWAAKRPAQRDPKIQLYLATRHAALCHLFNERRVPAEDLAYIAGHKDGGGLIVTLYGHPDETSIRNRVREAWGDLAVSDEAAVSPSETPEPLIEFPPRPRWASFQAELRQARAEIPPLSDQSPEVIVRVARQVMANDVAAPRFNLDELASALMVTPARLESAFVKYGSTPYAEWNRIRLLEAAYLLATQPSLKVQEVAQRIGFGDASGFSQAFARELGVTPSALRRYHGRAPNGASQSVRRTRLHKALDHARSTMARRFSDPDLTLSEVAADCGYNDRTLQREFAAQGTSFRVELRRLRVAAAKELIAESGTLPIAEVAERVGYRQAHSFSGVFKRELGISPSQLRRQIHGHSNAPPQH